MRKQKFSHEKRQTEGPKDGGSREAQRTASHQRGIQGKKGKAGQRKKRTEELGKITVWTTKHFRTKRQKTIGAIVILHRTDTLLYSIILVLPYILSAKQRTYRFPVKAEETGNLRNSHLKISTHMSNQQTFFP